MPHDPKTYRAMSEPYPDRESASAAVDAFAADLSAIRKKHRIADVYCVVAVPVMSGDGAGDADRLAVLHHGSSLKAPLLAAYGFGVEKAGQEQAIIDVLASAVKEASQRTQ